MNLLNEPVSTEDLIDALQREALGALERARAPYSGFQVGAAVYTEDGKIYTGCNIENSSLTLVICAERVALLNALSDGAKGIKAIMVVSGSGDFCYPCGICRQFIAEFAPDSALYIAGRKGIKKYSVSELLPHPFVRK